MLDIVSTRMLGQVGFLAKVFSIFEDLGISVDVVASSEKLVRVVEEVENIAVVNLLQHRSIISLIGNVQRSSLILEKLQPGQSNTWLHPCFHVMIRHGYLQVFIVHHLRNTRAFHVLRTNGLDVQMISQGASKVNISLIVNDSETEQCVSALHSAFFETDLSHLVSTNGNGLS